MAIINPSNVNEIELDDQKGVQAKAFAYWSKRYRTDVLKMSLELFGNYLTSFIRYLLQNYGNLLTEKDREKCEERISGELTEMVRGFEIEKRYSEGSMNQAWRKYFMLFCITGNVESDFDLFSYLNTGDAGLLPNNAWERKEIPLQGSFKGGDSIELLIKRIETLEREVSALKGGAKLNEYIDELINLPVESLEEITIDIEKIESKLDFNPESLMDARERTNRAIIQRQGQSKFRAELLKVYSGKCAITDCDAEAALEAAHIFPYLGDNTNHVKNGLLLRADIHTLFDLHLISIDPDTNKVVISSSLLNTCYKELNGKPLKSTKDYDSPSPEAIAGHYKDFLLKQNK